MSDMVRDAAIAFVNQSDYSGSAEALGRRTAFEAGADAAHARMLTVGETLPKSIALARAYLDTLDYLPTAWDTAELAIAFAAGAVWQAQQWDDARGTTVTLGRDRTFQLAGRAYSITDEGPGGPNAYGYEILDESTGQSEDGYFTMADVQKHVNECLANGWPLAGKG